MTTQWKVTDAVSEFASWLESNGIFAWKSPGISVDSAVKACFEGLAAIGAGSNVTLTRDANGRLTKLEFGSYNETTYDSGVSALESAISSHDDLEPDEGYTP